MSDIEEKETIVLLADLLASQLGLNPNLVFIYNQKWMIPNVPGLFIEIAENAFRPFGQSSEFVDVPADNTGVTPQPAQLVENQVVCMQEVYTVTLYSRNALARRMQSRLPMALNSVPAQQLQEKYSFQIGSLPLSFVDVSRTEGAAILSKYAYTFQLLRSYTQGFIVEYFDKFQFPGLILNP